MDLNGWVRTWAVLARCTTRPFRTLCRILVLVARRCKVTIVDAVHYTLSQRPTIHYRPLRRKLLGVWWCVVARRRAFMYRVLVCRCGGVLACCCFSRARMLICWLPYASVLSRQRLVWASCVFQEVTLAHTNATSFVPPPFLLLPDRHI